VALINNNTYRKTYANRKARFSCLLQHPARKQSGSILTTVEPAQGCQDYEQSQLDTAAAAAASQINSAMITFAASSRRHVESQPDSILSSYPSEHCLNPIAQARVGMSRLADDSVSSPSPDNNEQLSVISLLVQYTPTQY